MRELIEDVVDCGPGTCGPDASLYISNWRCGPLHSDPRIQDLLRKSNYPESAFKEISQAYDSQDQMHGRVYPGGSVQ